MGGPGNIGKKHPKNPIHKHNAERIIKKISIFLLFIVAIKIIESTLFVQQKNKI
jgi:hypothetical protein